MADKETLETTYKIKLFAGYIVPHNYINFIRAKWMRSYRFFNDYMKLTDSDSYYAAYKGYIARILRMHGTIVRLAVLSDDEDVALGFSVISGSVLHYVYVGPDYRWNGIGKRLVPAEIEQFTHLTRPGLGVWATKNPKAKFNPFQ